MQQSGGLNEIAINLLVRMKPGADSNQNRVGLECQALFAPMPERLGRASRVRDRSRSESARVAPEHS